jgi:hypothetical protein
VATSTIASWIRLGVLALPLYGLLTFFGTLTHQPDPNTDIEAWSRYVTTTSYLVSHLVASIGGTILFIFGVFALAVYLTNGRAGSMGLVAMLIVVVGSALQLTVFGASAFAVPAIGDAYLAGYRDVAEVDFGSATTAILGLSSLLFLVGNVLLGVAVWRSGTLPRWAGVIYAAGFPLLALLGFIIGAAQSLGTLLIVVGGGWIAWSIWRKAAAEIVGSSSAAPRVR